MKLRRDLTEDQVARLLTLTYIEAPRDWYWLLNWATGTYSAIPVITFSGGSVTHKAKPDDLEAIVSGYENPLLWDEYTEEE